MIVSAGEGKHEDENDIKICQEVGQKISIQHSDVFMVILTSRVWTMENRYKYVGVSLFSAGLDYAPSHPLFRKLSKFEKDFDILQDWR
jgi:hypothetical protein